MNRARRFDPVAVRAVFLDRHVPDLGGLEGYASCLVVFRFDGTVVGQSLLPVLDGKIGRTCLLQAIPEVSWMVYEHLTRRAQSRGDAHPLVSLVVCTHNRPGLLCHCLNSLREVAWEAKEILVVDSHPVNEETRRVAEGFPAVRYIRCPKKGLDIARNAGLSAAHGTIVAFTDDDARVDPGWVHALVRNFDDPMVAVVTGITLPFELETEAQLFFEQMGGFRKGYARKEFSLRDAVWAGAAGAGVNMALRRSTVQEVGVFDEALDSGTPTRSGGDHDYFSRALARGYTIVYEPAAIVWHQHRGDMTSVRDTLYGYGVGVFAWWTRALLLEREYALLYVAPMWFMRYYMAGLLRAILGLRGALPARFSAAELLGALKGPFAYLQARYFSRLSRM